ncbi:13 kDa ribonucleoprotein-associated protein [Cucumispora dikerogammari]|nr:13 kDa ribonucleoprotein-associated protein [Cucumispora dikerogammari]
MSEKLSPLATPELEIKILEAIANNAQSKNRRLSQGINEVTKKLNKGKAELVIMAVDAQPVEIIFHLKILCEDKDVIYVYVSEKSKIGEACGSGRGAAAVCLYEDSIGVKEILNELHF